MEWYLKVLKNYAGFGGRARRKEFWMFFLVNMGIGIVLNIIGTAIDFLLLGTIYSLAVMIPYLAVGVRRIHDTGKSGWFILIPIYNIILFATEGDKGANDFGDDPKGAGAGTASDDAILDA